MKNTTYIDRPNAVNIIRVRSENFWNHMTIHINAANFFSKRSIEIIISYFVHRIIRKLQFNRKLYVFTSWNLLGFNSIYLLFCLWYIAVFFVLIKSTNEKLLTKRFILWSSKYSLKIISCVIGSNNAMYLIIALGIQGVKSLCNETNG